MKQGNLFNVVNDAATGRTEYRFDGETVEPERDCPRLSRQLDLVRELMLDGAWRSLATIALEVGGSEAGVSARLRDLRKPRFGEWTVQREYQDNGLWLYRVAK